MPPATSPGSRGRTDGADTAVRFRRAVVLMVMTLFLPGSAQLVAGNKRVGRVALRVVACLAGLALLLALLAWVWPGALFTLGSSTGVLGLTRWVLIALALGWAFLFVDAWRLGEPLGLVRQHRLAVVGINGLLCFSVAGGLLFGSHLVSVQRDLVLTMFGDGTAQDAFEGRFNVLLLGGDSGDDRWGMRPDSLTVASIDEDTGRTVLFGLPRNMSGFPFPKGSVMGEQFPEGWECDDCYLNSVSTWARDHEQLFTGDRDPGVQATVEAVEGITGLRMHYFAMVNMAGFSRLVDAVGGIRMHVRDRIPKAGIGEQVTDWIEPGDQTLDGADTLWFARSRLDADDYSRMARQKCVMNAMLDQLSPARVLRNFEAIARASSALITTDLPASELDTFAQLALKAKGQPLRTVSFTPPLIDTARPDIDLVHQRVRQALEASRGTGGEERPRKRARPRADAPTTGGSVGSLAEGYAANDAEDLDAAC